MATYRRDGFLNFIYFTDFEDLDPQAYKTSSQRATAQTNCGDKYRAARPGSSNCTEIQFITGDKINGPFHTNDDILLCGSPIYGRDAADRVEVSGPPVGLEAEQRLLGHPDLQGSVQGRHQEADDAVHEHRPREDGDDRRRACTRARRPSASTAPPTR